MVIGVKRLPDVKRRVIAYGMISHIDPNSRSSFSKAVHGVGFGVRRSEFGVWRSEFGDWSSEYGCDQGGDSVRDDLLDRPQLLLVLLEGCSDFVQGRY